MPNDNKTNSYRDFRAIIRITFLIIVGLLHMFIHIFVRVCMCACVYKCECIWSVCAWNLESLFLVEWFKLMLNQKCLNVINFNELRVSGYYLH